MSWFSKQDKRIALVIKDYVIRYVEAKQTNLRSIVSYGERYLPPGVIHNGKIIDRETLLFTLEECIETWKLKRKKIFFLVPESSVIVRTNEVEPQIPADEIKGHLYLELGETIHLPFENPVIDFSLIEETDQGKKVILVAAPEATVQQYIELLEEVKLRPVVADIASLSLCRLLNKVGFEYEQEHLLVLNVDLNHVNTTIFHKDIPIFSRNIKMKTNYEQWEVQAGEEGEKLVWAADEDIDVHLREAVNEIVRVADFYRFSLQQGGEAVTRVLITGDYPQLEKIETMLKSRFEIPVEILNRELFVSRGKKGLSINYFELIGLAMKKEVQ
ncbi:pilus assembly protein PilM [Bacillus tianshenii]|nr:pilus assembly protein PilM [Bacillus tianshenii]